MQAVERDRTAESSWKLTSISIPVESTEISINEAKTEWESENIRVFSRSISPRLGHEWVVKNSFLATTISQYLSC